MKIIPKNPIKNHNVSHESDTQVFFRYAWFFLAIILIFYAFFFALSFLIIQFVSIDKEKTVFSISEKIFSWSVLPESLSERYKDIPYSIELIEMDGEENAFASLWGKIYITQALLENIETYEALDFIVWHEIGHIENRDVLRSLISGLPIIVTLSLFWGDYGTAIFDGVVWNTHWKLMENKADRYALDFVHMKNLHVWCAMDFFVKNNTLGGNIVEAFSDHPMTDFRIKRAKRYMTEQWYETNECTILNL